MKLQATDYYTIKLNSTQLYDLKVLCLLYQPIIGFGATALYQTLNSEVYKQTKVSGLCNHYRLCQILNCTLEQLLSFRQKLEAVGLLKSFLKKHREGYLYLYELYTPLDAHYFFKDPILHQLYRKQITDYDYEQTLTLFKLPQIRLKDELVEVSVSAKTLFELTNDFETLESQQLQSNQYAQVNFKLDLDYLHRELQAHYLPVGLLNQQVIDVLSQLSLLYQLSETHLLQLLLFAVDGQSIDLEKLKSQALNLYTLESYQKPVEKALENPKQKMTTDDPMSDFFNYSPVAFLTLKYNNVNPPRKDLKLLDELMTNYKFPIEVVNLIIDYVLRVNDGKLTKNFVDAIATSFAANKINDLDRAMTYLKKWHTEQKNQKPKRTYKRKDVVENYQKDQNTDETIADEAIADLLNSL